MKRVEFETKINIDAKIGDKSVNECLSEIAGFCHYGLEYSSGKNAEYENLIDKEIMQVLLDC